MNTYRTVRFAEIATSMSGGTPSKGNPDYWSGMVPWVSPKDMHSDAIFDTEDHISQEAVANSAAKIVPSSSILAVVRSGILVRRFPVAIAARDVSFNQDIKAFSVDCSKALPEYVFWWLKGCEQKIITNGVKKGATVHSVAAGFLENLELPLPPLDEQRRIVDILNHAASMRRLREQAQTKAREIIPALFLDMFGDPDTNLRGWKLVHLSELATIQRTLRVPDHDADSGAICFGPDSVEQGTGRWLSRPTVAQIHPISGKYEYEQEDVIYSKIRPLLRKAVISDHKGFCSADMYPLTCTEKATPEFLHGLLLSSAFTKYSVSVSTRAQMPKINRKALFAYKAVCPPILLQREFSQKVGDFCGLVRSIETAGTYTSSLSRALLAQSFEIHPSPRRATQGTVDDALAG